MADETSCELTAAKVDVLEGRMADIERRIGLLDARADDAELSAVVRSNEFKRASDRVNTQHMASDQWRIGVDAHMKADEAAIAMLNSTLVSIDAKLAKLIDAASRG